MKRERKKRVCAAINKFYHRKRCGRRKKNCHRCTLADLVCKFFVNAGAAATVAMPKQLFFRSIRSLFVCSLASFSLRLFWSTEKKANLSLSQFTNSHTCSTFFSARFVLLFFFLFFYSNCNGKRITFGDGAGGQTIVASIDSISSGKMVIVVLTL